MPWEATDSGDEQVPEHRCVADVARRETIAAAGAAKRSANRPRASTEGRVTFNSGILTDALDWRGVGAVRRPFRHCRVVRSDVADAPKLTTVGAKASGVGAKRTFAGTAVAPSRLRQPDAAGEKCGVGHETAPAYGTTRSSHSVRHRPPSARCRAPGHSVATGCWHRKPVPGGDSTVHGSVRHGRSQGAGQQLPVV